MDSNLQVLSQVVTPTDRSLFLEDLRCIEQSLYHLPSNDLGFVQPTGLSYMYGKQLYSFISKQKQPIDTLKQVRQELEGFEVMTLTVGFVPTATEAEKIVKDARNIIGQRLLVDLQIDKNLLGGVRLACGGKYADLGLATLVDKYFELNKANWLGRLKLL